MRANECILKVYSELKKCQRENPDNITPVEVLRAMETIEKYVEELDE